MATFGVYEYRNRAYHPGLGRFMSEDPKGFGAGDNNFFRYVGNDPLDGVDPMGLTDPDIAERNAQNSYDTGQSLSGAGQAQAPQPAEPTRVIVSARDVEPQVGGPTANELSRGAAFIQGMRSAFDSIHIDLGNFRPAEDHGFGLRTGVTSQGDLSVDNGMTLPDDPSGLGPEWVPDPSHLDPNGERYRNPDGQYLDWHPGTEGANGWKGKDHWHYSDHPDGPGEHLPPGTVIGNSKQRQLTPTQKVVVGAGVVGGGYLLYRGVRMIPSLFPPLWGTIPANLAVP